MFYSDYQRDTNIYPFHTYISNSHIYNQFTHIYIQFTHIYPIHTYLSNSHIYNQFTHIYIYPIHTYISNSHIYPIQTSNSYRLRKHRIEQRVSTRIIHMGNYIILICLTFSDSMQQTFSRGIFLAHFKCRVYIYTVCRILIQRAFKQSRARNNGRSTDNVRSECGVVRSNSYLAGHFDPSLSVKEQTNFI